MTSTPDEGLTDMQQASPGNKDRTVEDDHTTFINGTSVMNQFKEKRRDLTQSMTKAPTSTEMSKGQSDNTNNATKRSICGPITDGQLE